MDLIVGVQRVQVLGLVEIPKHGGTVLATGGAQRAIRGDGHSVDVAGVADVVSLQLAGGKLPDLLGRGSARLSFQGTVSNIQCR